MHKTLDKTKPRTILLLVNDEDNTLLCMINFCYHRTEGGVRLMNSDRREPNTQLGGCPLLRWWYTLVVGRVLHTGGWRTAD